MPKDAAALMEPQAHAEQLSKTLRYIDIAKGEGATLLAGGLRVTEGDFGAGYFVAPTVFANVDNEMRVAYEEIFGTVISVIPSDDDNEAIAIANDTDYGLTAGRCARTAWLHASRLARFGSIPIVTCEFDGQLP